MTARALLLLAVLPVALRAQSTGFSRAAAAREDSIERLLVAVPDTQSAQAMTRALTRFPHMAGTPAQALTRDYVLGKMREWGMDTWYKTYSAYLPQPDTVGAWVIPHRGATPQPLFLGEPPIAGDSTTTGPQVPPFNATGGAGDVTAEVVYVGFGLIEDYRLLDSLGVSVRGKIAIARYGRSYRGIKAREAERHGAVALILYSDPAEDGYVRGDVYPRGPMRPPGGIQHGSVQNAPGDPTTPGYASLPEAHRLPDDSLPLVHIPVFPMGYGNAQEILGALDGPSVPRAWQGGLPFPYHMGPGPASVHVRVRIEPGTRLHPIWDTFGMIRGAVFPDQWVIVGGHRDAWGPGADDNVSGVVSVLEAAHAFSELVKKGIRPARTMIFATWDAEEWGMVGSTEWVEDLADSLSGHVVAYINQDAVGTGTSLWGDGSPSMKPLLREATRAVPALRGAGSLYDSWVVEHGGDTTALTLDNVGGGSDFVAFYHHLGIPAGEIGFNGPSGVYHSLYDDYQWMTRFGDPGYRAHRAVARLASVILARLANSEVPPLDYVAFGTEMTSLVSQLDAGIARQGWAVKTDSLRGALRRFTSAARLFAAARDSALNEGLDVSHAAAATLALMQVERRLTRPQGLVHSPWFKSLQFAADLDNGYATLAFPTVAEAIRYGDAAATRVELDDLVSHVARAGAALDEARAALR